MFGGDLLPLITGRSIAAFCRTIIICIGITLSSVAGLVSCASDDRLRLFSSPIPISPPIPGILFHCHRRPGKSIAR